MPAVDGDGFSVSHTIAQRDELDVSNGVNVHVSHPSQMGRFCERCGTGLLVACCATN
jgi:hypothetical protein